MFKMHMMVRLEMRREVCFLDSCGMAESFRFKRLDTPVVDASILVLPQWHCAKVCTVLTEAIATLLVRRLTGRM